MLLTSWLASLKNTFPASDRRIGKRRSKSRWGGSSWLTAVHSLEARQLLSAVNDPPVGHTFTIDVTEDSGPQVVTLSGDDGDEEFIQQLTYAIDSNPAHGTLTNFDAHAGTVLYTPDPDYFGADSFSYKVSDDGATVLSLHGTISGNIASSGQVDTYTFSLQNTSTLLFDTLGYDNHEITNGLLRWTVKGDNGLEYTGEFGVGGPSIPSGLMPGLKPGNYTVSIDGAPYNFSHSYFTGAYQFRLVDAASATPIVPGTSTEGYLSPTNETDLYQFQANTGDRFAFVPGELGSEIPNARWELHDPLGKIVHYSSPMQEGTLYVIEALERSGTYTLLITGLDIYDEEGGEEEDVDAEEYEYSFSLYAITAPVTQSLSLGETVSGSIATPGASQTYSFSLTDRSYVYLDSLTADSNVNWKLTGPIETLTGTFVDSDYWAYPSPIRVLPSGDYTLTINRTGISTGDFNFRLLDLQDATPLVPGTETAGTLVAGDSTDLYRFTANAGDMYYFDLQSFDNGMSTAKWQLIAPFGKTVPATSFSFQQGDMGTVQVPVTGTYSLLIEGYVDDSAQGKSYSFNVVPVVVVPPVPMTPGDVMSGDLLIPGASDSYSFTLTSKTQLYFDALSADPNLFWSLSGPAGTISDDFYTSNWAFTTNPVHVVPAGDYTLTISRSKDSTGPYQFKLLNLADAPVIDAGVPIFVPLTPLSTTAMYRLDATAGNQFQFDMLSMTEGLPAPWWRLMDTQGNVISNSLYFYQQLGPITIPYSGAYTLLVEGYPESVFPTGDYSFEVTQLEDVEIPPWTGEPLDLNSVVSGSIDSPDQVNDYLFTITEDQYLYVDGLTDDGHMLWELKGPSGHFSSGLLWGDALNSDPVIPLSAGTYQFSVNAGSLTGTYQFNLRTLASATEFTPGTPINGTLDPALTTDLYKFEGMAGDTFFFGAQATTGSISSAQWRLVDPFGRLVHSAISSLNQGDVRNIILPASGTYTLLIEGSPYDGLNSGDYSFNIIPVVDQTPVPLILGDVTTGSIAVPGEVDVYSFTLDSFSNLHFNGLTQDTAIHWKLTGPAGTQTGSFPTYYGDGNVATLPAGTYTIEISKDLDALGDYSFQVLDLQAGSSLSFNTETAVTVGIKRQVLNFDATAGQQFYFQYDGVTGNLHYAGSILLDPNGRQVSMSYGTGSFTATVTGTYSLLVMGFPYTPESSGEFHCTLYSIAAPDPVPYTLGDRIAGYLPTPGASATYTFTLQSDTLVCLENYTPEHPYWSEQIRLTGPNGQAVYLSDISDTYALYATPTLLLPAGQYTLWVGGPYASTASAYEFRMVDLSSSPPVESGDSTSVHFSPPQNAAAGYTLQANAGDSFVIDLRPDDQNANSPIITIIDDQGEAVASTLTYYYAYGLRQYGFTTPRTGNYTILFAHSYYSSPNHDFDFDITRVEQNPAIPLTLDTDVTGTARPHQPATYTFTITTPTQVYLDTLLAPNDIPTLYLRWNLTGPLSTFSGDFASDEITQYIGTSGQRSIPVLTLLPGEYTLTIGTSYLAPAFDFGFQLRTVTGAASLPLDTSLSGHLAFPGAAEMYQFSAVAGNRFQFQADSFTGDANSAYWMIVTPDGTSLAEGYLNGSAPEFTIPYDGDYALLISAGPLNNLEGGDFQFSLNQLSDVLPPTYSGTPLVLNTPVSATLDEYYEVDDYTFTLAADTLIYVDGQSGEGNLVGTLDGPSGTFYSSLTYDDFYRSVLRLRAGNYHFSVSNQFATPAAYQFNFRTLDSAIPLTPGTPASGTLTPGSEAHLYQFNANAGDSFYIDLTAWDRPGSPTLTIVDPYGNYVTNPRKLPFTGTYTLSITGDYYDTQNVGYALNVIPILVQQPQQLTSNPAVSNLTVQNVNDAPVLDNLGPTFLPEIDEDAFTNVGTTIAGLLASGGGDKITDVDGDPEGVALTYTSLAGGTWQYTLDGGSIWSDVGTVGVNNALLLPETLDTRIRFVPDSNFNGSSSIEFVAWDRTSGSAGTKVDVSSRGFSTSFSDISESALVTVNPVNDAPVMTTSGSPKFTSIPEDVLDSANPGTLVSQLLSSLVSTGGSLTDIDAAAVQGIAVTTVDQTHGTWQYTTDNGANWSNFNTPSASAARLLASDANTRIRFRPAADFNGNATISFVAWDQSTGSNGGTAIVTARGGTKAFSLGVESASITVTPVNNAPVLVTSGNPTLTSIAEDTLDTANPGTLISTIIANLTSSGGSITDSDTGALKGIAVTSVDQTHGTWQYTVNNGTTWLDFGTPTASAARLLASVAGTKMRFRPNADYVGSPTFLFVAWDQTTGTNGGTAIATNRGGTKAFSLAADTGSITITPVNDAPILNAAGTPSLTSIARNIADGTNSGTLISQIITNLTNTGGSISDIDAGAVRGIAVTSVDQTNGTWQFTTDNGANWVNFGTPSASAARLLASVAGTKIRFKPNANYVGNATFLFVAWDQSSGTNGGTAIATNRGGIKPFSLVADTATINVFIANSAPVLNTAGNPTLSSIVKDVADSSNSGTLVSQIITNLTSSGGGITDSDGGTLQGIAITSIDQSHGTWQYTTDDGSHWLDFGTPTAATARLLASAPGTKIRFKPTANYVGNATFLFVAWDQSTGVNGGTGVATTRGSNTAFSLAYDTAVIKVA